MLYNWRTKQYLQDMNAVKVDSKYKVMQVNYHTMQAFVNQQDVYVKRNGKKCNVEHHFGKWVPFTKDDISYGMRNFTAYDSSVHGLELIEGQKTCKYLRPEVKKRLISEYESLVGRKINFTRPKECDIPKRKKLSHDI